MNTIVADAAVKPAAKATATEAPAVPRPRWRPAA
jgi:hypothetical protein